MVPGALAGLAALLVAQSVDAQVPHPAGAAGQVFAIHDVRVFDGERLHRAWTVVVRDGRIEAAGSDVEIPSDVTTRIRGDGLTLLPGMIDAHTHTFDPAVLRQSLAFGVTTVLDQFTAPAFAATARAQQEAGEANDRADLLSAGVLATADGGHGTQFGVPVPTLAAPEDAPAWVAARKGEGSSWIKIAWEDGSTYGMTVPTLDEATVGAVIEAAHAEDLLVVVHVATRDHARRAAALGADGLVHAPHDGPPADDLGEVLAAADMFVVPTLTVIHSIATGVEGDRQLDDERLASLAGPAARTSLGQSFPSREGTRELGAWADAATGLMLRAGVPILAGSDAPNPGTAHGLTLHREMERLVEVGLTPIDALRAATSAPADAFGLEGRGRIVSGARADLVLVEGDPTRDITATRNLRWVWKGGVPLDVDGERERVAEAEAPTAAPAPVPGPVSDFDDGTLGAVFGSAWTTSTDVMAGGSSTVEVSPVDGHMLVAGELTGGGPATWAGAMFFPGAAVMAPADLSTGRGVTLRVRGDERPYAVMFFTQAAGGQPVMRPLEVGSEWAEIRIDFGGIDASGLMGIFIGAAGPPAGSFELRIDDVRIH